MRVVQLGRASRGVLRRRISTRGPMTSGMPGVSGPLVDDEGFPRGDIDLYAVRQARNKLRGREKQHERLGFLDRLGFRV